MVHWRDIPEALREVLSRTPPPPLHDGDFRLIPNDVAYGDLIMTHSSVNFDRSGYQQRLT